MEGFGALAVRVGAISQGQLEAAHKRGGRWGTLADQLIYDGALSRDMARFIEELLRQQSRMCQRCGWPIEGPTSDRHPYDATAAVVCGCAEAKVAV